MKQYKWTHKPTWAESGDENSHATDRIVCVDGETIARIYVQKGGPSHGKWSYFPQWYGAPASGQVETMEEALDVIRRLYLKSEWEKAKLKAAGGDDGG